ncbi:MAG: polysaccharide deacetylase family protein [Marivirga sp.]|nr:polysaccharide deacetylase family protein [Marivirga sp.]
MIHRTPFFLPLIYPTLTWRIPTTKKELFLTFDDGPVPGPTEFVLDTLENFNAKATFFCIGDNIKKYPDVFRRIISQGHAVGNHTLNHLNGWKTKTEIYLENFQRCNREIHAASAGLSVPESATVLFRPPYGRITRNQINALSDFRIVMWDVLSVDYNSRLAADKCLNNTIRATRTGSIIVFHDSYKAERNLTSVLPVFMRHFSALGFEFKSLSQ